MPTCHRLKKKIQISFVLNIYSFCFIFPLFPIKYFHCWKTIGCVQNEISVALIERNKHWYQEVVPLVANINGWISNPWISNCPNKLIEFDNCTLREKAFLWQNLFHIASDLLVINQLFWYNMFPSFRFSGVWILKYYLKHGHWPFLHAIFYIFGDLASHLSVFVAISGVSFRILWKLQNIWQFWLAGSIDFTELFFRCEGGSVPASGWC